MTMLAAERPAAAERPRLMFFHSSLSGRCRRVEAYLARVLQHRRSHETFEVYRVAQEERRVLLERFGIEAVPTICVVEGKRLAGRLEQPRGAREIQRFLQPWLR
jgi:thioredoxin-like negative regulator of GroEL